MRFLERLQQQFSNIKAEADAKIDLIQPTPEEKANGWDAETLTEYIRDRETNSTMMIYGEYKERPTRANSRYKKLRW